MSDKVTKMADILRSGATMLSITCPQCNTPLFKYKGEIYCANCNRKVKILKDEGAEPAKAEASELTGLAQLEIIVLDKIDLIVANLKTEADLYKLERLAKQLALWLDILERLRRISKI